ncbi:PHO85 cyclin-1 [Dipsacomyces acuminosporus]|nr:PHO85 cyclin-1 [Dipsacomyces acuminosporus]
MASNSSAGQGRQQTAVYNLYHIPRSLVNFTANYLSKLFCAVDKPQTTLKQPPHIDNRQYPEFKYFIETLLINGHISADTLVHALIYLSRFHRKIPRRQPMVEEGAKHKIFLSALLIASKFCDDRYPLATISVCEFLPRGLFALAEVNRMERAFLSVIKYKLIVNPEELSLLLLKHGIDIKRIAQVIAERTNSKGYVPSAPAGSGSVPNAAVGNRGALPLLPMYQTQRAIAGHSTSVRKSSIGNGAALINSTLSNATLGMARLSMSGAAVPAATANASTPATSSVLHSAHLETVAKRPSRVVKPLPVHPMSQPQQQTSHV